MRVGILGGTFDPVHLGHLIIAGEAAEQLSLDRVVFVPAGNPWFKEGNYITPASARLEMLRLAVESNPLFCIDTQELERDGPTYTVDTLEELRNRLGGDVELYFIIGLDAVAELARWKKPERIVELCRFAAMRRPGYTRLEAQALDEVVPGVGERVCPIENIQVEISSSDIRRRVQEGLSIRYLVPEPVERYIRDKGIYRTL